MAKQTFTTGQVLTADNMTSLQQTAMGGGSATAKIASYTLVAADAGTTVIMNSASATTITVNTALFAAGDTVFIVNQGAGVCTVTAGTATVSTAGSLAMAQNETGQLYFLSTSAAIFREYTQTSGGGGKLGQLVSTIKSDTFTMTGTTFTDVTGLSVTITPAAATSKIFILVDIKGNGTAGASTLQARLLRGSTVIAAGDTAGSRTPANGQIFINDASVASSVPMHFLDSPATTSATTYKVQINASSGGQTSYVNRAQTDTDATSTFRYASTITVMEILA